MSLMTRLLENDSWGFYSTIENYTEKAKDKPTRWIEGGAYTQAFWKLFLSKKLTPSQVDSFISGVVEAEDLVTVTSKSLNLLLDHKMMYCSSGELSYEVFEFFKSQFAQIDISPEEVSSWKFSSNQVCFFIQALAEEDSEPDPCFGDLLMHPEVLPRLKRVEDKVQLVRYLDGWSVFKHEKLSTGAGLREFFQQLALTQTELAQLLDVFEESMMADVGYSTESITEVVNTLWRGFFYYLQKDKSSFWDRQKCSWLKSLGVEDAFDEYDNLVPPTKEQWSHYCDPTISLEQINALIDSAAFCIFAVEDYLYFDKAPELFAQRWRDNLQSFGSMPNSFKEKVAHNFRQLGLPDGLKFVNYSKQYSLVHFFDSHNAQLMAFDEVRRFGHCSGDYWDKENARYQTLPAYLIKKLEAIHPEFKNSPLFVQLAVIHEVLDQVFSYKDLDTQEIVTTALATVKGWFDLSKKLPNVWKWRLYFLRSSSSKDSLTLQDFLATPGAPHIQAWTTLNGQGGFEEYNPFDERGGFCVATWKSLLKYAHINTEKIELFTANAASIALATTGTPVEADAAYAQIRDHMFGFNASVLPCFRLAYLYGSDWPALAKRIEEEVSAKYPNFGELCENSQKSHRNKIVHDLGQFNLRGVKASVIKAWRPYLIKYPKLLKFTGRLHSAELPEVNDTLDSLIDKLLKNEYSGVPAHLSSHVVHAMENGWDQDVMDEFVTLVTSRAKKKALIPNVHIKTPMWSVRCLEPTDPTALYIGELSGCCQHINEGAGNDAAIQSFTEEWCSVLVIESPSSGKLIAQSFLWLSKSKKSVVMDSVESIFEENDPIVQSHILPAIEAWATELKEKHGINVLLSDTDYGVTNELRSLIRKKASSKIRGYQVNPYKDLEYTDVNQSCYKIL